MSGYGKAGFVALALFAALAGSGQASEPTAPDIRTGAYWRCEHATMAPDHPVFRSHISAIVDDAGRIWAPSYQVIETNARYGYDADENWPATGFAFHQLLSSTIQLDQPPTRPLWQQVLADGEVIERQLAVAPSLIARGEAHETIWGITLRDDALSRLVRSEDWRLQLVDEDGAVIIERALKDRSRADMAEEQRVQIAWLRDAAQTPAGHCTRSTPESRAAEEASVT